MIKAITFAFWDCIALDDSAEPQRAAAGPSHATHTFVDRRLVVPYDIMSSTRTCSRRRLVRGHHPPVSFTHTNRRTTITEAPLSRAGTATY